jgi:hypothetical protein
VAPSIELDTLTPAELRALDYGHQLAVLSDLMGEAKRLADAENDTLDVLFQAENLHADDPTIKTTELIRRSKVTLKKLGNERRARNQQTRILQTLIRSSPQIG